MFTCNHTQQWCHHCSRMRPETSKTETFSCHGFINTVIFTRPAEETVGAEASLSSQDRSAAPAAKDRITQQTATLQPSPRLDPPRHQHTSPQFFTLLRTLDGDTFPSTTSDPKIIFQRRLDVIWCQALWLIKEKRKNLKSDYFYKIKVAPFPNIRCLILVFIALFVIYDVWKC